MSITHGNFIHARLLYRYFPLQVSDLNGSKASTATVSAIQLEQVAAGAVVAGRRQSNALRQLDVEVAKSNALATRHPGEPSPSPRHAMPGTNL